jgi:hypothetical protein
MKAITLHRPWADWVGLGWKTIETRTHERFRSLVGQRIAIHASLKWDEDAIEAARYYLLPWQLAASHAFRLDEQISGRVLCTAIVAAHRLLTATDARAALIECHTRRFGLFLTDRHFMAPAVKAKGHQGIWNWTP